MTLYVSDLDGTLLNNNAELSPYSKSQLIQMIGDGVSFTVASARSVSSIRPILAGLNLKLPVIEFNGAFISDLGSGKHEITNAIDADIAVDLYHFLSQQNSQPFLSTFNGTEDCLYCPALINEGTQRDLEYRKQKYDPRLRVSENITSSLREQVVCLTSIGRVDHMTELASQVSADYGDSIELHLFENQYSPGWYWMTIHDRRATKDQAIRILMDTYGLSAKSLVVFGDHENDLKMFSVADEAIAVGNALPSVKGKATTIIGNNETDSVVKFIDVHRQKNWKSRHGDSEVSANP